MKRIVTFVCIGMLLTGACTHCDFTNKKELILINPTDSVVYFDETPEYARDSRYLIKLQFNNKVARIDNLDALNFKVGNNYPKYQKDLFFAEAGTAVSEGTEDVYKNPDYIITVNLMDSLEEDVKMNNSVTKESDSDANKLALTKASTTCDFRIPAETFTDIYGNKNKAIHILYKRKRK